jgi:hypothetical protein
MAKKQNRKKSLTRPNAVAAGPRVLRGRGDYDFDYETKAEKKAGKQTNPIVNLSQRVTKLENKTGSSSQNALKDAGSLLGGLFGPMGSKLGGLAGGAVSSLLGHGDYTVKNNSIMTSSQGVPSFNNSSGRWTEISHREYLFDVISPAASPAWGIVATIDMNPGISTSFPWLAAIANNYDEWCFDGCVVCYESTSGSITTTQALGSVQIASQYDVLDAVFSSQLEMLESEFATSEAPDTSFCHPIECNPRDDPMFRQYVRAGPVPTTALQLYDLCKTSVAVQGVSLAGVNLGKVWITYKIRLGKPKLFGGMLAKGSLYYFSQFQPTNDETNIFGTDNPNNVATRSSGNGNLAVTFQTNTIRLPPFIQTGKFLFVLKCTGTSAATSYSFNPVLVNCTSTIFDGTPYVSIGSASTNTQWSEARIITVTGQGATFTYAGPPVWPTSTGWMYFFMTQISSDFVGGT